MNVDYTITLGNITEVITIVIGGLGVVWALKSDVNILKAGAQTLKDDLGLMQAEIRKLGEIMVNLADIRGELRVLSTRITANEQDIRELKHGDGYVKGPRGLDREYDK